MLFYCYGCVYHYDVNVYVFCCQCICIISDNSSLIDNVFTSYLSNALSAYILNVHISDHQPVILFTVDDLLHKKLKYITIKTNSEEAKKHFCSSFKSKNIMDLLDRNIYDTDPNEN